MLKFVTNLFKGSAMIKKLGMFSLACLSLIGCVTEVEIEDDVFAPEVALQQPTIKMPNSIIVCRAKQCAPAKLSMSKEFVYNTLLHMFDSNARKKAPVCEADPHTHACTEEFISVPVTVGITPAYLYVDDVKITDVSISKKNTSAMDLVLNWNISYNGQTPVCRPSKTLLYAKNIDNVIMEDNGYNCKMTTVGTSSVKTLFAIDYIDLDYGYIGGFYSIGLSGPAFGGGSGYMIIRLPNDISMNPEDFQFETKKENKTFTAMETIPVPFSFEVSQDKKVSNVQSSSTTPSVPAPNVDTIIKYSHPSLDYDKAKAELAKKQKEERKAVDYNGVKVFPVKHPLPSQAEVVTPEKKNSLNEYNRTEKNKEE